MASLALIIDNLYAATSDSDATNILYTLLVLFIVLMAICIPAGIIQKRHSRQACKIYRQKVATIEEQLHLTNGEKYDIKLRDKTLTSLMFVEVASKHYLTNSFVNPRYSSIGNKGMRTIRRMWPEIYLIFVDQSNCRSLIKYSSIQSITNLNYTGDPRYATVVPIDTIDYAVDDIGIDPKYISKAQVQLLSSINSSLALSKGDKYNIVLKDGKTLSDLAFVNTPSKYDISMHAGIEVNILSNTLKDVYLHFVDNDAKRTLVPYTDIHSIANIMTPYDIKIINDKP